MEFEELNKIWETQNNEPRYAINEQSLRNRILSKKQHTSYITNLSELLLIIVNFAAGVLVLAVNVFRGSANLSLYLLSAWMLVTAAYILVNRIRRIKMDSRYDRSLRGDLQYAISVATYQVRLSRLMRWNILPIGIFILLGIWEEGKSIWIAVGTLILFIIASYASKWEHNMYTKRKDDLESLRMNLDSEESNKTKI